MTVSDVFKIFEYFLQYIKSLTLRVNYSYNAGCSIASTQVTTFEGLNSFLSTQKERKLNGRERITNITYKNRNKIQFWITNELFLELIID